MIFYTGALSRSVFFAYLKQFFAENVLEFWVVVQDFCKRLHWLLLCDQTKLITLRFFLQITCSSLPTREAPTWCLISVSVSNGVK